MMIVTHIRQKMHERGFSAHALEKKAGLKSSAIHNILYGRSKNPSIKVIKAIADALECEVAELIEDDYPPSTNITQPPSPPQEGVEWNSKLYLESFEKINWLLKRKRSCLTKEQILNIVEEVYLYSKKTGAEKVDENFAEWLVNKSI